MIGHDKQNLTGVHFTSKYLRDMSMCHLAFFMKVDISPSIENPPVLYTIVWHSYLKGVVIFTGRGAVYFGGTRIFWGGLRGGPVFTGSKGGPEFFRGPREGTRIFFSRGGTRSFIIYVRAELCTFTGGGDQNFPPGDQNFLCMQRISSFSGGASQIDGPPSR